MAMESLLLLIAAVLLAFWWAWSPQSFAARSFKIACLNIPIVFVANLLYRVRNYNLEGKSNACLMFVLSIYLVATLPLALRIWRGWVICRESTRAKTLLQNQFSLFSLLLLTTHVAILLSSLRTIHLPWDQVLFRILVIAVIAWLAVIPLVYLLLQEVVTESRTWLATGYAVAFIMISPSCFSLLLLDFPDTNEMLFLSGVMLLLMATNLAIVSFLRFKNYRLHTLSQQTNPSS
jgi:hypothetical protein